MEVGDGGGLNVLLAQNLHFDWCVGEVEGKVVEEVRQVGGCTVDHCQGIAGCTSGSLCKRPLQEFLGEALHVGRLQTGQLVGVGVQNRCPAIGLPLLMHEAPVPGARLQAGAADVVVLVGKEGGVPHFRSAEVGVVVVVLIGAGHRLAVPLLLHTARQGGVRAGREVEICTQPCRHSLNLLVAHAPDLSAAVFILTVPLLLFLLQEVFLEGLALDVLIVEP